MIEKNNLSNLIYINYTTKPAGVCSNKGEKEVEGKFGVDGGRGSVTRKCVCRNWNEGHRASDRQAAAAAAQQRLRKTESRGLEFIPPGDANVSLYDKTLHKSCRRVRLWAEFPVSHLQNMFVFLFLTNISTRSKTV